MYTSQVFVSPFFSKRIENSYNSQRPSLLESFEPFGMSYSGGNIPFSTMFASFSLFRLIQRFYSLIGNSTSIYPIQGGGRRIEAVHCVATTLATCVDLATVRQCSMGVNSAGNMSI